MPRSAQCCIDRLQPGQLLQVDRENNFIEHMVSAECGQASRAEKLRNRQVSRRRVAGFRSGSMKPTSRNPIPRLSSIRDAISRARGPHADNEQIVIAAQAFAHERHAPIRHAASHKQQDEIHHADQQNVGPADITAAEQIQPGVDDHQHDGELADDIQDEIVSDCLAPDRDRSWRSIPRRPRPRESAISSGTVMAKRDRFPAGAAEKREVHQESCAGNTPPRRRHRSPQGHGAT